MKLKVWEINTKNGFVNCVGFTKKQALEIIIKSMIYDENNKVQEEQKKRKACKK